DQEDRVRRARAPRQTDGRCRDEEGDDLARQGWQGEEVGVKHFVLDTNVLIHDPRAIFQFADNEVVIPIFVIEEIDNFKKEASERGRTAREMARLRDGLPADGARLSDGAALPNGGRLRVASAARSVPTTLRESQIADH